MQSSEGRKVHLSHERIARIGKAAEDFRKNAAREGLWAHQSSAMDALSGFFEESVKRLSEGVPSSGAIVMPTGCGKTVLAAETARALGLRAAVLAPTVQIALQHFEELNERAPGLNASLYYGGSKDLGGGIIVTTYHSALSLFEAGEFPETDVAFYDEAHRSLTEKRMQLQGAIAPIGIGLTATPAFNPMRQIWSAFDDVIYDLSIREAVEMGAMSSLRGFILETSVDASGVKLRRQGNLLDESQAERVLNVLSRNRVARDFYLEHFKNDPAVVFCITQNHADEFAAYLRESGVRASSIHGRIPGPERERRLAAFEDGSLDVLTTRDVLIEGWDSKRVLIELCLRPTYSLAVKTHMVGRVARVREGKESGIVVEFEDAYRFGEQPVLAHHVLDLPTYRQGGLIAAPSAKMDAERKMLSRNKDVTVKGNLKVSFAARTVFNLDSSASNLRDPRLLREILSTAILSGHDANRAKSASGKLNLTALPFSALKSLHLNHPEFSGTLETLAWRVFGMKRNPALGFPCFEDYKHLISLAHDDMPREHHDKSEALPTSGSIAISAPPDEICDALRQKAELPEILKKLPDRQGAVLAYAHGIGLGQFEEFDYSHQEIAKIFGFSPAYIGKIYRRAYESLSELPIRKRMQAYNGEESPNADKIASAVLDERIPIRFRETMLPTLYYLHPSDRIGFFSRVLDGPFSHANRRLFGVLLVNELKNAAISGKGGGAKLSAIIHNPAYPWRVRKEATDTFHNVEDRLIRVKGWQHMYDIQAWRSPEDARDVARTLDFSYGLRVNAGLAYVNYLRVEYDRCYWEARDNSHDSSLVEEANRKLHAIMGELKSMRDDKALPDEIRDIARKTCSTRE